MTDPRMPPPPTNDALVTVEETLRWYAEMTEQTLGSSETGRRALDHDGGRRAYACLAALASAPAGFAEFEPTEAMWQAAWDASEDYFISDKATVEGFRIAIRAMLTAASASAPAGDGVEPLVAELRNPWEGLPNGLGMKRGECPQWACDLMQRAANALARPRAAVGEREAMAQIAEHYGRCFGEKAPYGEPGTNLVWTTAHAIAERIRGNEAVEERKL